VNTDEKTCPECAETIKAAAKVCKHCGYRLEPQEVQSTPDSSDEQSAHKLEIFYCPSCKKPTRKAVGKCGHCHARFDSGDTKTGQVASWSSRTFDGDPKPLLAGCGVMVLVIGGLLLSQCGDAEPEQQESAESVASDSIPDNFDLKYAAQQNLKVLLKDSDSARYEGMFLSRIGGGNLMLCGKVNSKNSFGAYTGFKRFIASPNPDAPTLIEGEASGMGAGVDAAFPQAYTAACSNVVERF
jgi:hypothetical protein